jgi:hypothetical protein
LSIKARLLGSLALRLKANRVNTKIKFFILILHELGF